MTEKRKLHQVIRVGRHTHTSFVEKYRVQGFSNVYFVCLFVSSRFSNESDNIQEKQTQQQLPAAMLVALAAFIVAK